MVNGVSLDNVGPRVDVVVDERTVRCSPIVVPHHGRKL